MNVPRKPAEMTERIGKRMDGEALRYRVWDARRSASSERKTMPAMVSRVRATLWRRLVDRPPGLRPARGRRLRIATVADGCQTVLKVVYLVFYILTQ